MSTNKNATVESRPRGRPRLTIDRDAVADAVAELFHEGGYEAVSIVDTAERLSVSRATLYRTVPTKQDLIGILYERSTRELTDSVKSAMRDITDPGDQLRELVRLQTVAAVEMRYSLPIFFGGGDMPKEVVDRFHAWSRRYEKMWASVITANMEAGNLEKGDPVVTTRLILGMIMWVSRWYRPKEKITTDQIAEEAIRILRLDAAPAKAERPKAPAKPRKARASTNGQVRRQ